MKKAINTEHIEGRVYEHELTIKTVQNQQSSNYGKEFISGTLSVAVDEEGMNIVEVHFTYVTETTKAGKKNTTYTALKKIIDEGKAWITDGKDEATKVKIDNCMKVMKFGGTSVGSVNSILSVKQIVEAVEEPVIDLLCFLFLRLT